MRTVRFFATLSRDGIVAQAIIVVCIISRDISSSCFFPAALSQKQVRPLPSGVACPLPPLPPLSLRSYNPSLTTDLGQPRSLSRSLLLFKSHHPRRQNVSSAGIHE